MASLIPVTRTTSTVNRVIESDLIQHIEDTPFKYTAIRNQRFVQLTWNELDDSERRAIRVNMFHLSQS